MRCTYRKYMINVSYPDHQTTNKRDDSEFFSNIYDIKDENKLLSNIYVILHSFCILLTSNKPVLSTGPCSARIGRRSRGHMSK